MQNHQTQTIRILLFKNHRKERIFVFKKICAGIYKTITTFWANTGPLQDHFQKTLYTEKRSVYKTGWQHW